MTDDTSFDHEIAFNAAQIEAVRMLLKQFPQLAAYLGSIQTFKMVIDVNMVARELKRRFQSYGEPTLTEHLVEAGILELHFPKWGEIELEARGAFQRIAKNMNLKERDLREQWDAYKACLIIDPDSVSVHPEYAGVMDTLDTPYAITMDRVGAIGILSADKKAFDVSRCRRMSRADIEAAEAYAASMSELLGVRISVTLAGSYSIVGLIELIKQLQRLWTTAPKWAQILVLTAAGAAIASPTLRRRMIDSFRQIGEVSFEAASAALAADAERKSLADSALSALEPPIPAEKTERKTTP